jgi:hypothetical protein
VRSHARPAPTIEQTICIKWRWKIIYQHRDKPLNPSSSLEQRMHSRAWVRMKLGAVRGGEVFAVYVYGRQRKREGDAREQSCWKLFLFVACGCCRYNGLESLDCFPD